MSGSETTPRGAPLTPTLQFLCMFDKGPDQGAFGPRHILTYGARITGSVDSAALRDALYDVVVRHEALRTTIVRDVEPPYQLVHPPAPPELVEYQLSADEGSRETAAYEFYNRIEAGQCPIDEQPLLRAALGRFDDQDSVLVLYTHHMVTDGWSLQIIMRDLVQFYAARRGFGEPDLPALAQYGEYAEWQQAELGSAAVAKARAYWRDKLDGASMVPMPTDRTRTDAIGVYSVHRFVIDREITSATQLVANQLRCSPFMILFAAYTLLMHRVTGLSDLTLPTITSGRNNPRFHETVGPIFNFMPLRTDLSTCHTFRDLLVNTRATCLEMYANEIPFSEAIADVPDIVEPFADLNSAVQAFQCFQFPAGADGTLVGDVRISELRRRVLSDPNTANIPDGAVWALDIVPDGEIFVGIKFDSNDLDEATMVGLATEYQQILRTALANVDAPLDTPLAA